MSRQAKRLVLRAPDAELFVAQYFEPEHRPSGGILICPALAVPQRFYARWAEFLTRRGFAVLTLDYRGIADSRAGRSLRVVRGDLIDCIRLDAQTALAHLGSLCPMPLAAVGHSFGGAMLGILQHPQLRALLQIASPAARSALYPKQIQYWLRPLTRFALPALSYGLGYAPAQRLGLGEDVPKRAILQWCRATRHPDYLFQDLSQSERAHVDACALPLLACHFSDDPYAPRSTIDALLRHYPSTRSTVLSFDPKTSGLPSIGHFGAFRSSAEGPIWTPLRSWLETQLVAAGASSNTA